MNQTLKNILLSIFKDENGVLSSKRTVGVISGLALVVYAFIWPSDEANNSVLILALGALSITTVDKFVSIQKSNTSDLKDDKTQLNS